jgi:small conductance mechanosensitive channel
MFYFLETTDSNNTIPGVKGVTAQIVAEKNKIEEFIEHYTDEFLRFLPALIWALVVLIFGLWVIKRIASLAEKAMVKKDLEVSLRTFLKSLISTGLKVILIVTFVGMLGIGTTGFVTILGAAGLAVGLALQGSLSNFAGGVLILIFKPFKVGDTIEAQGMVGEVKEIQIFNTILLTGEHKTAILPNGPLSNGAIVNNTRFGNLRIDVEVRISNDNDLERVKQLILLVLNENEKVLKLPLPSILITSVNEGLVTMLVRPFCLPAETGPLQGELYYSIYSTLEKNNVNLPAKVTLSKVV